MRLLFWVEVWCTLYIDLILIETISLNLIISLSPFTGILGYVKAGSKPSLYAGLAFGTLLGIGTYMTSVNPNNYYL